MHAIAAKVKWNNLQYEMFQCFISRITRIENGVLKYGNEWVYKCTCNTIIRTTLVLWVGAWCAAIEWWFYHCRCSVSAYEVLRVNAEYLSNVRQRRHTTCGIKVVKVGPDTWAALRSTLKLRFCYGCLLYPLNTTATNKVRKIGAMYTCRRRWVVIDFCRLCVLCRVAGSVCHRCHIDANIMFSNEHFVTYFRNDTARDYGHSLHFTPLLTICICWSLTWPLAIVWRPSSNPWALYSITFYLSLIHIIVWIDFHGGAAGRTWIGAMIVINYLVFIWGHGFCHHTTTPKYSVRINLSNTETKKLLTIYMLNK